MLGTMVIMVQTSGAFSVLDPPSLYGKYLYPCKRLAAGILDTIRMENLKKSALHSKWLLLDNRRKP